MNDLVKITKEIDDQQLRVWNIVVGGGFCLNHQPPHNIHWSIGQLPPSVCHWLSSYTFIEDRWWSSLINITAKCVGGRRIFPSSEKLIHQSVLENENQTDSLDYPPPLQLSCCRPVDYSVRDQEQWEWQLNVVYKHFSTGEKGRTCCHWIVFLFVSAADVPALPLLNSHKKRKFLWIFLKPKPPPLESARQQCVYILRILITTGLFCYHSHT